MSEHELEIKALEKKLKQINQQSIPACILIGVTLRAWFAPEAAAFAVLKDRELNGTLLTLGLILSILQIYQWIGVYKQLSELRRNNQGES